MTAPRSKNKKIFLRPLLPYSGNFLLYLKTLLFLQIVDKTYEILKDKGYTFVYRGLVKVKGKGTLTTYYITGKLENPDSNDSLHSLPNSVSTPL